MITRMSERILVNKTEKDFESIKHIDENGVEFWYARELMTMLDIEDYIMEKQRKILQIEKEYQKKKIY